MTGYDRAVLMSAVNTPQLQQLLLQCSPTHNNWLRVVPVLQCPASPQQMCMSAWRCVGSLKPCRRCTTTCLPHRYIVVTAEHSLM